MQSLDFVEKETLRRDLPPFRVGDAVRVHVKVKEGEKERIQIFEGVVIRRRGHGIGQTFTVRKISSGVGVERVFPVQSPLITKVEIKSRGFVRRSRLYYLRDLTGKKARLHNKVRDLSGLLSPEQAEAPDVEPEPVEAAPVADEGASEAAERKVSGKERKKANAKAKAERRVQLAAESEKKAAAKAAKEAKEAEEAAAAAAEAPAEEPGES